MDCNDEEDDDFVVVARRKPVNFQCAGGVHDDDDDDDAPSSLLSEEDKGDNCKEVLLLMVLDSIESPTMLLRGTKAFVTSRRHASRMVDAPTILMMQTSLLKQKRNFCPNRTQGANDEADPRSNAAAIDVKNEVNQSTKKD